MRTFEAAFLIGLLGCQDERPEAPSPVEVSAFPETPPIEISNRSLESLQPRKPIFSLAFQGSKSPIANTELKAYGDRENMDRLYVLLPDIHIPFPWDPNPGRPDPLFEAYHRDLFFFFEYLVREYGFSELGFEQKVEFAEFQTLFQNVGLPLSEFLGGLKINDRTFSQLNPDYQLLLQVGLNSSLTFEQKRQALLPLVGRYPARLLVQVIYGDAKELQMHSIDVAGVQKSAAMHQEFKQLAIAIEGHQVMVKQDPSSPEVPVLQAKELALQGNSEWAIAYCKYRNNIYLSRFLRWYKELYGERDPIVATNILRELDRGGIVYFGADHMTELTKKLTGEGATVIMPFFPSMEAALAKARGKTKEAMDEELRFTPLDVVQDYTALMPDLMVSQTCKTVLSAAY